LPGEQRRQKNEKDLMDAFHDVVPPVS